MSNYDSDFEFYEDQPPEEEYVSKNSIKNENMRLAIKLYRCFPLAVFVGSLISFYIVVRPTDLWGCIGLLVVSAMNWFITIIAYNLIACEDVVDFIINRRKNTPE